MMANKGLKFVKNGMLMTLLTWLVIGTACNDQLDNPKVNPSNGKQVEVSLNIGFADEDDGISLADTRSNNTAAGEKASTQKRAFDAQLISAMETRAGEEAKPDQLYNLEIRQYNASGTCQNSNQAVIANQSIGSRLTISLTESEDCQLVIVAWGTSISNRLGTDTFSKACDVIIDQSDIKDLDPTKPDNMKKMPYYIYLPSVKVSADGTITNPDGTDVRLLLKRLATRVTLNWNYAYTIDYDLKEVRLEGVPSDYRAIPFINTKDNTYPSLLDQYTTIIVPASSISNQGSYSCWIPASLRGTSNKATSAYYRNKENAPTGSVYATFIAQNKVKEKKKLNYRLYLGSNTSDNFDLNPNTNYNYQVNFAHKGLPTNDRRVSIIDPIPASEGNDFLSPTANCFMVAPGGAFCFDPFTYRQNGVNIENSTLTQWATDEGGIAYVKLLWQTKENGDLGDPVMGVVNSATDHSNIVEIKRIDGGNGAPTGKGQARIYCRVAPNTTGGSGVIAAYNASNRILWSWHVWVTDYMPNITGKTSVYEPANKRKHLYTSNSSVNTLPMMDRNLGAFIGLDRAPNDRMEITKANGFHYQRGRKDPYSGTFTTSEDADFEAVIGSGIPPKNFLNRYEGNGLSWITPENQPVFSKLRDAYATPLSIASSQGKSEWCNEQTSGWNSELKGLHDPCPVGWRIPRYNSIYQPLIDNNSNPVSYNDVKKNGGVLLHYEKMSDKVTYIRYAGYVVSSTKVINVGINGYLNAGTPNQIFDLGLSDSSPIFSLGTKWNTDVHTVRCVQERE